MLSNDDSPTLNKSPVKTRNVTPIAEVNDPSNEEDNNVETKVEQPAARKQSLIQPDPVKANQFMKQLTKKAPVNPLQSKVTANLLDDLGIEMSELEDLIDDKLDGLFDILETRIKGTNEVNYKEMFEQMKLF